MKNIVLSAVAIATMSTFAVAGGDIAPIEEEIVVPAVVSDTGAYLGLAYSYTTTDINTIDSNTEVGMDFSSVMFQAGYKFNSYIAVEGRYWLGLSSDDYTFANTIYDDNDFDAWGIYVKPMYPVTDAFNVYGLLGYGSSTTSSSIAGNPFTAEATGFSWGLGAEYSINENVAVFVDYVAFAKDDIGNDILKYEQSSDSVNFGVTYKF